MIYEKGITVIEGNPNLTMTMLYDLCISSVVSFDKDILFIDGKNSFDPYIILKMFKLMRTDNNIYRTDNKILSRIHITRAFTEFQMKSLIEELNNAIELWNPSVLIISYLSVLFSDSDINLFKSILDILEQLNVNSSCETIVVTSYGRTECDKLLASKADRVVSVKQINDIIRIIDNGIIYDYAHLAPGQRLLV